MAKVTICLALLEICLWSSDSCGKLREVATLLGDSDAGALNGGAPAAGSASGVDSAPGEVPAGPVPLDLSAIEETFAIVSRAGDKAVAYFYGRLFAENPGLRVMFPASMDYQRDRLFRALTRIVRNLGRPEEMEPFACQLGEDHRKYGVQAEHYPAVGQALLATLRKFAGDAWTAAAESAWAKAYERAAELMTTAAAAAAEHSPPLWTGEVIGHELRTPTLAVLTVRTDVPFPYLAGQHVSIQSTRWHRVWRPFSVANAPRADGTLSFHIRAVPGGWVSTALVHHTRIGDLVNLGPPRGTMTLAAGSGNGLFCVAGGTGLAPIKALIEQAIKDSTPARRRKIRLFLGVRRKSEFYDLPDLWGLETDYPWLRITPAVSDEPGYSGIKGLLPDIIARHRPRPGDDIYISGPYVMVQKSIEVLRATGMRELRMHADLTDVPGEPGVTENTDAAG
jgi:NAD(P)H-flavin reductase/hemoglobin-like flavoprotein